MPKWDISSRKRKQHKRCLHAWCIGRCCVFQMAQPDRVLGVCLIHCTGTTAGFMESMKDKVSAIPLYQHNSRPCGVHGRWCERQTLWSPWKMGSETRTLWSRWKTRWVPFYCTSTTADLVEAMKDEVKDRPCGVHERWCERQTLWSPWKMGWETQTLWSRWKTRWVPFYCTSTTADLVEAMKDEVKDRPWGVHERWCERQTLWSPWKMGWETQTLWSQWKTRWVPFHCTSTTADFAESLNDEGVYSFISLHWQCHFFACILGTMNDIDKVGSSFALYWHCTFTANLVESMNDKVGSSFSVYWCYSWPCWVHEWQSG